VATLTGTPSAASTSTLLTTSWWLKCPEDSALDAAIRAAGNGFDAQQQRFAAVFHPEGQDDAVVLRGPVHGDAGPLPVLTMSRAEYDALAALLDAGKTLLLQGVLGRQWYVEVTGNVGRNQERALQRPSEQYPVRHFHRWTVPLTEVAAP